MASFHSLPYLVALATTFSIVILCSLSLIEASNDGFSVELMHRDSPKSPFYDPSETPQQRLANTLRRSINRVNHFRPTSSFSTNAVDSEIVPDSGEYLMQYAVGTPPVKVFGIADTGSDLTWLQCAPCTECYKQKDPIFDPAKSSTYKTVPCTAPQCRTVSGQCVRSNNCEYTLTYGDGSSSGGDVALDTVTLGSTARFPQTVIGCGHDNTGVFSNKGSGIVGLGNSAISLVSQLSTSIAGKFSYCLVPFDKPDAKSKLNFGTNAVVSGPGAVTTPLTTSESDVFYTLTLEAVSVGPTRINPISAKSAEGNIIIDSGTTLTVLPSNLYTGFEAALKAQIKLPVVKDPEASNLCFYSPESTFKVPTIIAHFTGGADVTLSAPYTFLGNETITCMAFTPADDDIAIFGNLAQADQLVGYDIVKKTVSFKPTDCTKA